MRLGRSHSWALHPSPTDVLGLEAPSGFDEEPTNSQELDAEPASGVLRNYPCSGVSAHTESCDVCSVIPRISRLFISGIRVRSSLWASGSSRSLCDN